MPKLQEKPSALKREHPVLKNMKILFFFYFCWSFLPSWIRIRIRNLNADPNPATQINADPCGSGSETLSVDHNLDSFFPDDIFPGIKVAVFRI
jgi:hypothetical protein